MGELIPHEKGGELTIPELGFSEVLQQAALELEGPRIIDGSQEGEVAAERAAHLVGTALMTLALQKGVTLLDIGWPGSDETMLLETNLTLFSPRARNGKGATTEVDLRSYVPEDWKDPRAGVHQQFFSVVQGRDLSEIKWQLGSRIYQGMLSAPQYQQSSFDPEYIMGSSLDDNPEPIGAVVLRSAEGELEVGARLEDTKGPMVGNMTPIIRWLLDSQVVPPIVSSKPR